MFHEKTLPIYEGLLLVVGKNQIGKTAFLNMLKHGNAKISGIRTMFSFMIPQDENLKKEIISDKQSYEDLLSELSGFCKEQAEKHVPTYEAFLNGGFDQSFSTQRYMMLRKLRATDLENTAIVIDEPELFMHPLMKREMVALVKELQKKGACVVVATNDACVASDLLEDVQQVVRMDKKDGKALMTQIDISELTGKLQEFYRQDPYLLRRFSSHKHTDTTMEKMVNEYGRNFLSSVMKPRIFDVMFSNVMVLGEGSSESVFFDYLEQELHADWTREEHVHFMSCLGKSSMPFYFIFFGMLGIRTILMYDFDNDTNPVHVAYDKAFKAYEDAHPGMFAAFAMVPDLEHVLSIQPPYKLASMEKPVNVYQHSFVSDRIYEKAEEVLDVLHQLVLDLKKKGENVHE